jgi:glycosyltransferase involved in cell wall biosynthesis
MTIALVHDALREYGGAERVLESMHSIWPEAPVYTSFVDWKGLGRHADRFSGWDIRPSWVQRWPVIQKFISPLRFIMPAIWGSIDLSGYDVVVTSSGWFIPRGVNTGTAVHICYLHHPPRNLYGYPTGSALQKYWIVRVYAKIINFFLRQYDYETAQRVDWFIANSQETARRIRTFYRRESTVIYPPIDIPKRPDGVSAQERSFYLSVCRLSYAKRVDLAIEACNRLRLPLVVVGTGKEEGSLKHLAGNTIRFTGAVSDAELDRLYGQAKALIFCALDEDFGMVPVEAMARGTPVIGLAQGGVTETVADGKTGILFSQPTAENLVRAIGKFERLMGKRDSAGSCRNRAETFATAVFTAGLKEFVATHRQRRDGGEVKG